MRTQQVLIYAHATIEAEALTDRLREAGWDALMSAVVREQHAQVTVIASRSEWIDVTVGSAYHCVCGQGDGRGRFDHRPTTLDGILSAMSRWEDSLTGEDDEAVESWDGSIHTPKPPRRQQRRTRSFPSGRSSATRRGRSRRHTCAPPRATGVGRLCPLLGAQSPCLRTSGFPRAFFLSSKRTRGAYS